MPDPDGTVYCSRQDRVLDIERCYICEWAVRYDHRTECGFDDVGPFRRITAAIQRSVKKIRDARTV